MTKGCAHITTRLPNSLGHIFPHSKASGDSQGTGCSDVKKEKGGLNSSEPTTEKEGNAWHLYVQTTQG